MASVGIIAVDVVGIVVLGLYASWLAHLQLHKEERDRLLKRYKPGTPAYHVYYKAYSARALLSLTLITLGFILNLFKNLRAHLPVYIVGPAEIFGLACFTEQAHLSALRSPHHDLYR